MKRIVPIVAGPFPTKWAAFWWAITNTNRWPGSKNVRRYRLGWYLLDRSPDTHHVGSKAWRKRSKALYRAHPEWFA